MGIVGIGATIVVDQALADPTLPSVVVAGTAVSLFGASAGFVLGWAQWFVLRGCLPTIRARNWVAATAIGGVFSWLFAMTPNMAVGLTASNASSSPAFGVAGLLAIAVAAGAASGIGLSAPQFFVLRSNVKYAGWWLGANALAWMIVTPPYLTAVESMARTNSLPLALLGTLGAAGITGSLAGCIHGRVLVRLVKTRV